MTLGEKLQLLRRSRGLSQEQLAAELDVSRQAISKWECGDSTPDLDKLRTICTYFGVTTDYLIWENEEDVPTGGANTAEPMKRENVRETLRKNADWAGYALAIIGAALLLRLLVSIIVMLSLGGWDAFPAVLWTCLPHILAYAVLIAGGIFLARWLKKRGDRQQAPRPRRGLRAARESRAGRHPVSPRCQAGRGGVKCFCFRRCESSGRAFESRRRRLFRRQPCRHEALLRPRPAAHFGRVKKKRSIIRWSASFCLQKSAQ